MKANKLIIIASFFLGIIIGVVLTLVLSNRSTHNEPSANSSTITVDSSNITADSTNSHAADSTNIVPQTPAFDGIDVSHNNGVINWKAIANNSNIQFVYIKATQGATWDDASFNRNFKQAKVNGFKVGVYHFFTNANPQAQFNHLRKIAPKNTLELIPMIDVEASPNMTLRGKELRTNLLALAQLMTKYYGVRPIIYCSESFYNTNLQSTFSAYPKMIAHYSKAPKLTDHSDYIIWQFSDSSHIQGHPSHIDISRFANSHTLSDILLTH